MSGSWIAQERGMPRVPVAFWIALILTSFGAFGVLFTLVLGMDPHITDAERGAAGASRLYAALQATLGLLPMRVVSAAFSAAAVAAVAGIGLRLLHSPLAGTVAAILVATDPAFHAQGQLATPLAPVLALCLIALLCFLQNHNAFHIAGGILLVPAAALEPLVVLWGVPLLLLLLLRGHIYAAPKHLGVASLYVALPLALGVVLSLALDRGAGLPACQHIPILDAVFLSAAPALGGTRYALHNPAIWFGGLGTLAFLAGSALVNVVGSFRVQRLPGRLQLRLADPLPRGHGRALWLLVLVLAAPLPILWMPLLALAMAAGVRELSEDARGFGLMIGVLVVAFALVFTVRLWGLVDGSATPAEAEILLSIIPWLDPVSCAG